MHMGCVYDGIPEALQSSETERSAGRGFAGRSTGREGRG